MLTPVLVASALCGQDTVVSGGQGTTGVGQAGTQRGRFHGRETETL